jgi:DNA-binding transcriptional regulator YhcF (GntR family)
VNLKPLPDDYGAGIEIAKFIVIVSSGIPVYLQLAGQLKDGIDQRQYDPEKPLPSVYKFNRMLGISGSTVFRAYKHVNKMAMFNG